jgi:cobalamin biosynthesis Mg chelatase CobN
MPERDRGFMGSLFGPAELDWDALCMCCTTIGHCDLVAYIRHLLAMIDGTTVSQAAILKMREENDKRAREESERRVRLAAAAAAAATAPASASSSTCTTSSSSSSSSSASSSSRTTTTGSSVGDVHDIMRENQRVCI